MDYEHAVSREEPFVIPYWFVDGELEWTLEVD